MPTPSPPARCQQLATTLRRHKGEILLIVAISKVVLFSVGLSEYGVASSIDGEDSYCAEKAEIFGHKGEVTSLQTVSKRHPCQVTDSQHEPESIRSNVHLGKDGCFIVECINDVPCLESTHEEHAVSDSALEDDILMARAANVEQNPEYKARTEFIECLDVKGADSRVQLTTNEPVEEDIARIASLCKQLVTLEADGVDVDSLKN